MARVTVEDCVEKVPNRFSLVLLSAHRARAVSAGAQIMVDRDNDKNPVVALREIADDVIDAEGLKETLIGTLQRVDERSEAEEEAETLALLADPQHMHMSEQELVRALQSDRDGGQEERYRSTTDQKRFPPRRPARPPPLSLPSIQGWLARCSRTLSPRSPPPRRASLRARA